MEKVRFGVIGVGNMGTGHLSNYIKGSLPQLEVTAVADRKESRRKWAKENLPESVKIFEEGSDLIASGLCDAVLIATPHYQHPTLAIEAFAHKIHVMCEKPAGVYTKAVREMNEAAEKSGCVFGMMFNQRTNCLYRKMHELVNSGELGAIKRVNWIITDWYRTQIYYDSGAWRATWAGEGGGVLLNQCPHQLDLLQWICGLPSKVHAFCHIGKWHDIEVEDDVTAYLEYPNGATGVFITSTGDAPGTNRLEMSGDRGKIVIEDGVLKFWELEQPEQGLHVTYRIRLTAGVHQEEDGSWFFDTMHASEASRTQEEGEFFPLSFVLQGADQLSVVPFLPAAPHRQDQHGPQQHIPHQGQHQQQIDQRFHMCCFSSCLMGSVYHRGPLFTTICCLFIRKFSAVPARRSPRSPWR